MELTEDAFSMYDSGESRVPGDFYWKENILVRAYNWGFRTSSPKLLSPAAIISASATATLTSSTDKGAATVEAKAEFLEDSTTVEFLRST